VKSLELQASSGRRLRYQEKSVQLGVGGSEELPNHLVVRSPFIGSGLTDPTSGVQSNFRLTLAH
jgi:hypothetical protein